jgi:Flp pilus assembly protein TadG
MRKMLVKLLEQITNFLKSRRGNVAIITALVAPVIVGFCGVGAEAGYWYFRQADLQAAADSAAFDGTMALRSGATSSAVTSTATKDATSSGWLPTQGTITVNTPPTAGTNQNSHSVEVLLSENEQRYFSSLFATGTVPIRVRAVATYNDVAPACMLGLNKSAPNTVQFWGNAYADFTSCNIVSDSIASNAFSVGGSARVIAPCVETVGGDNVQASLTLTSCSSVTTNAPYVQDPYANVPSPSVGTCSNQSGNGGTLNPATFCGGLSLKNNVTLNPGVYVINGGTLKVNANANVTGTGVTFYLTNGATVQFNGSAQISLTAPTSGSYAGLVLYGDRTQPTASNTINGNASSSITGAIYFPSQEVDFLGNFSGANGCTQVVADTIYYTGSATFNTNCTGTGMRTVNVPGSVTMVE